MQLLIVNYHYFGEENQYPGGIYPISPERFKNQLAEIGRHFDFISQNDLIAALDGQRILPEQSCLITFDDGLKSQFTLALPILKEKKIPAVFFIGSLPLKENKVLNVHKIHYLLSVLTAEQLLKKVVAAYQNLLHKELPFEQIDFNNVKLENRYDQPLTSRLKFLLNKHLPNTEAEQVVDLIFQEQVKDEAEFCRQHYLNQTEVMAIADTPLMAIGLHSHRHPHLLSAAASLIARDFSENHRFLTEELNLKNIRAVSYPFGQISPEQLKEKILPWANGLGLKFGLTMGRQINQNLKEPFYLSRFDTNDLPQGKKPVISFDNL